MARAGCAPTRCHRWTTTRSSACRRATSTPARSILPTRSFHRRRRSEEHTSELQSRLHLVCRLLLEKKKKKEEQHTRPTQKSQPSPRHTRVHKSRSELTDVKQTTCLIQTLIHVYGRVSIVSCLGEPV